MIGSITRTSYNPAFLSNMNILTSHQPKNQFLAFCRQPDLDRLGRSGSLLAVLALLLFGLPVLAAVAPAVQIELSHPTLPMKIGVPAVIKPGAAYPSFQAVSSLADACSLSASVVRQDDGAVITTLEPRLLQTGKKESFTFEGNPSNGRYLLQLRGLVDGKLVFNEAYSFTVLDVEALPKGHSVPAHLGKDGTMVYIPDYRGNRIPDFSMVGYRAGAEDIPEVPATVTLEPSAGDDTKRIQDAINQVSALPLAKGGFRGAVLLKNGVYRVKGGLAINTDGVVLRGEGPGKNSKQLLLDPAANADEDALIATLANKGGTFLITDANGISIAGSGLFKTEAPIGDVLDTYVPVGATTFAMTTTGNLRPGDAVVVRRNNNDAWIQAIGMDRIPDGKPWNPSEYNLDFRRIITAVDGEKITIDAPIPTAIETVWGGGKVFRASDERMERVGVENLRLIQYCRPDPAYGLGQLRGKALSLANVKHVWIRDVVAEHYCDDGAFLINDGADHVTVKRCSILLADDKYFDGYIPRYGFAIQSSLNLVQDCFASNLRHAYYVDYRICGPNVFHQCVAENDVTSSEPHHRWSSGGLYDSIHGSVAMMNRGALGSGHGWAGANYVAWNTRGRLTCERPPTAQNWAIGHVGAKLVGPNHDWRPEGGPAYDGGGYGHWELHRDPCKIEVKATATEFNRGPESTLDDNPYTYWMATSLGEAIEFTLPQVQDLTGLKLSFPAPKQYRDKKGKGKAGKSEPLAERNYFFEIAVSTDGSNWRTILSDCKGQAKGAAVFATYAFDKVQARHIRITARGSDVSAKGGEKSTYFHLSKVRFEPEPKVPADDNTVPAVVPASLYLQQLKERYHR